MPDGVSSPQKVRRDGTTFFIGMNPLISGRVFGCSASVNAPSTAAKMAPAFDHRVSARRALKSATLECGILDGLQSLDFVGGLAKALLAKKG